MVVLIVSAVLRKYHARSEIWFLVVASAFFYGQWSWSYLLLIYTTVLVDFFIGIKCHQHKNPKRFLIISLWVNLSILGFFKYGNLLITTTNDALTLVGFDYSITLLNVLLPVGISFYTFQSLSYTIDCARKDIKPETNLINYALFVSFFPQLVAGPIVRAREFFGQLYRKRTFSFYMAQSGVFLIVLGCVKKIVFADQLAAFSNPIFSNPEPYQFIETQLAIYAFAFQLYFDFSGYTDIAIGIARLLGFNFPRNFNYPYTALSVRQFWQRWHITLSRWLRDYVYRSLGGAKKGPRLAMLHLFLTMLIAGIWHGASWNFAVWGGINGAIMVMENVNLKYKLIKWNLSNRLIRLLKWLVTFHVICLAGVFFRVPEFDVAIEVFNNLSQWPAEFSLPQNSYFISLFILALPCLHWLSAKVGINHRCGTMASFEYISWLFFFGVLLLFFGGHHNQDFFYFQF